MREKYQDWNPRVDAQIIVAHAEEIIQDIVVDQGYDLTLRQLYYQFVSKDLLPNNQKSYDKLGIIINSARLAGLIDWDAIVDRTRNLESRSHWDSPGSVIRSAARSYHRDLWSPDSQITRVEVWVEKEALAGVVARAAEAMDCAWFACRGYVSQSEMREAGQRFMRYHYAGQRVVVLHLGDHDPSGIDMSRDIEERLVMFTRGRVNLRVERIALNMDQVEEYQPPPNPAKLSDSRATSYIELYGDQSWELDALPPATLDALIREHIELYLDRPAFEQDETNIETEREQLTEAANRWDEIVSDFLNG